MNKFYFFKVTLSYFDDERKTFFITPDQSETDEQGVPFSENDLQNTAEFKDFVKKTKADIIDVDYTEYAVEYDPKKSDILNKPVTSESFSELEKSGLLNIIDENQFPSILKKTKKQSGGSKLPVVCIMVAAIVVLGACAYKELSKRSFESETSDNSEALELNSDETSDSGSEDEISDASSGDSYSDISESNNSSTNSENTHEVASTPESSASTNESDSSDSSDGEVSDTETSVSDIFNLENPSDMAVTIYYDVEEPAVYFVDPNGNTNLGSSYTVERGDKYVCYYIPNAMAGQWVIVCDKKGNTMLNVNWEQYGDLPQIDGESYDFPPPEDIQHI